MPFQAEIPADEPSTITLWREHLDVAIRGAGDNYRLSVDDNLDAPYVYVGPGTVPDGADGFWNQPFGRCGPGQRCQSPAEAQRSSGGAGARVGAA